MKLLGKEFILLGKGAFNQAYVSTEPFTYEIKGKAYHQHWVFKQALPQKQFDPTFSAITDKNRAVRLWNELYPELPATTYREARLSGILMPFFGEINASGKPVTYKPTDDALAEKMIVLYKATRRIIADGCGKGNFLLFNGEVVCVDVDMALRSTSPVSRMIKQNIIFWKGSDYPKFWQEYKYKGGRLQTVKVTCALLYLEQYFRQYEIDEAFVDKYIRMDVLNMVYSKFMLGRALSKETLDTIVSVCDREIEHKETRPTKARRRGNVVRLVDHTDGHAMPSGHSGGGGGLPPIPKPTGSRYTELDAKKEGLSAPTVRPVHPSATTSTISLPFTSPRPAFKPAGQRYTARRHPAPAAGSAFVITRGRHAAAGGTGMTNGMATIAGTTGGSLFKPQDSLPFVKIDRVTCDVPLPPSPD